MPDNRIVSGGRPGNYKNQNTGIESYLLFLGISLIIHLTGWGLVGWLGMQFTDRLSALPKLPTLILVSQVERLIQPAEKKSLPKPPEPHLAKPKPWPAGVLHKSFHGSAVAGDMAKLVAYKIEPLQPDQNKLSPFGSPGTEKSAFAAPEAEIKELRQPDQSAYADIAADKMTDVFNGDAYSEPAKRGYHGTGFSGAAGPTASRIGMPGEEGFALDELQHYKQILRRKVEAYKEYPQQARREGIQGVVTVKFLVQRDGRLKEIQLLDSSSFGILDQAALQAVTRANPFLPLPRSVSQDNVWFKLAIAFKLG